MKSYIINACPNCEKQLPTPFDIPEGKINDEYDGGKCPDCGLELVWVVEWILTYKKD